MLFDSIAKITVDDAILNVLLEGETRYRAIYEKTRKQCPKMYFTGFTNHLNQFVKDGYVKKSVNPHNPKDVEYTLIKKKIKELDDHDEFFEFTKPVLEFLDNVDPTKLEAKKNNVIRLCKALVTLSLLYHSYWTLKKYGTKEDSTHQKIDDKITEDFRLILEKSFNLLGQFDEDIKLEIWSLVHRKLFESKNSTLANLDLNEEQCLRSIKQLEKFVQSKK